MKVETGTAAIREQIEALEREFLSPHARRAADTRGRVRPEAECDMRTAFQRDRDRILHCKAFRRLKGKTQVFLAPEGDHYRTRLTHTLEVAQISRTIARALRLNEDLVEAIALAHDIGHTPFGHAGESVLAKLSPGGFHHATHSLRVVESLEYDGKGLNLTVEVRDGIRRHSKGLGRLSEAREKNPSMTLEAEIVRLCDCVAYANHDLDDAVRAGLADPREVPAEVGTMLGGTFSRRIDTLVHSLVAESAGKPHIAMAPGVETALENLRTYLVEKVYRSPALVEITSRAHMVLESLFGFYVKHPGEIPEGAVPPGDPERRATDYIAGMTDRYALVEFQRRFVPQPWADE